MPAFTRQHYIQVAHILSGISDPQERVRIGAQFAEMFKRDNPRFDDERFTQALYGQGPHRRPREDRRAPSRGRSPRRPRAATPVREYQGWANWETWNVALWFGNDEGLYYAVREYPSRFTARSAKDFVLDLLPDGTPDFDSPDEYRRVRWGEIAASFNEMRRG